MLTTVRASHAVALAVASSYYVASVSSLSIPFKRQVANANPDDPFNFRVVDLNGDGQIFYAANVTLDGQSFLVQLDTGSADLWIDTQNVTFSNVTNTNVKTTISYEDTTAASGDIYLAAAQFGNFSIPQQAFINAPGSNATDSPDLGLLGLGPADESQVYGALNGTQYNGQTVMYNLFNAYPNVSTYITFLLSRTNLGVSDGGIFTIGETDPNWTKVLDQPQLQVRTKLGQWETFMDSVMVNGKNYAGHGIYAALPQKEVPTDYKEKLLALFDTGTSTGIIPQYYFDAIYKDAPGFKKVPDQKDMWQVPCDFKKNVTMFFNGTEVPINPLDLTSLYTNDKNETICINSFMPYDSIKEEVLQENDFTLGDAFLRNVYILYNYGNWTPTNSAPPYVQLLPTTIQSNAWADFDSLNQARIDQWNQLGGQYNLTTP